jgi:hypothetical protein
LQKLQREPGINCREVGRPVQANAAPTNVVVIIRKGG